MCGGKKVGVTMHRLPDGRFNKLLERKKNSLTFDLALVLGEDFFVLLAFIGV